jgi:hypothetical protein
MIDPRDFARTGIGAVTAALAAAGKPAPADPLTTLWHRWQIAHRDYWAAVDACNALPPGEEALAADDRALDLYRQRDRIEAQIAATPATTLAGLILKLRVAEASLRDHTPSDEEPQDADDTGNAIRLLVGMLRDLPALERLAAAG